MIVLMSGVATSIIGYPCPLAEAIHNSESVLSGALFLVLKLHLTLYNPYQESNGGCTGGQEAEGQETKADP